LGIEPAVIAFIILGFLIAGLESRIVEMRRIIVHGRDVRLKPTGKVKTERV
jgi:hypothetical protein